jgi:replication factor C small subunit
MVLALEAAMWSEKYRPRSLDEMRDQKEIVERLKHFVELKTLTHCLFAGPPGSGKTTAALCLAHDLFGERFMDAFMELNASDARGIDVIRTTVKEFARIATISAVPFKILVLDEADNMTSDAQQALRRTMERFSTTCRFILSCNYSGKIIEPIQSRCAIFRFTPLPPDEVSKCLAEIAGKESVAIGDAGLKAIVEVAEGDLRRALNVLQSSAALSVKVTEEVVYQVMGRIRPREIHEMLGLAIRGDFVKARERLRTMLVEQGVAAVDIIRQIHSEIFRMSLPERYKVELADAAGEVDFRLSQGADEEVQLSALLARLALVAGKAE